MEPPTKRRRIHESEVDDSNDDELAYEPNELVARRDPDYQLSLKRAYADHKFHATMAHIFEKYGRDFEGIGDEIDMVTGEIVVNNGHLDRMRNEGDVGVAAGDIQLEGGSEDEGIFLGDLIDGDEYQAGEALDAEDKGLDEDEDDDEDRILQGRAPDLQLTTLWTDPRKSMLSVVASPPSMLSDPFYSQSGLGFGASPYGFAHGNYGFGTSPFAMAPWDLPHDFAQPAWSAPRPRSSLNFRGGRPEYPVQDGDNSIWASGSSYKESQEPIMPLPVLTMGPHFRKPVVKCRKKITPPARAEDDEGEDFILTRESTQGGTTGLEEIAGTDEEGECPSPPEQRMAKSLPGQPNESSKCSSPVCSGRNKEAGGQLYPKGHIPQTRPCLENKLAVNSTNPSGGNSAAAADNEFSLPSEATPDNEAVNGNRKHGANGPVQEEESYDHDCRRSARARKQVEFLGDMISWSQVAIGSRPSPRMLIELKPMNPQIRDEYLRVDIEDSGAASPGQNGPPEAAEDNKDASSPSLNQQLIIPDSQASGSSSLNQELVIPDSQTSGSTAELPTPMDREPSAAARLLEGTTPSDLHDIFALSDDEAPTFFLKPQITEITMTHPIPPAQLPVVPVESLYEEQPSRNAVNGSFVTNEDQLIGGKSHIELETVLEDQELGLPTADQDCDPESPVASDENLPRSNQKKSRQTSKVDLKHVVVATLPLSLPKDKHIDSNQILTDVDPQEIVPNDTASSTTTVQEVGHAATTKDVSSTSKGDGDNPVAGPSASTTTPGSRPSKRGSKNQNKSNKMTSTPSTPRHSILHPTKAPSSRRSVLSLVSDDEDDEWDKELDELGRITGVLPGSAGGSIVRRLWKSSALTTEVYRTPVKKNRFAPVSPGSIVQTPGGTVRTCGVDGYRCSRDFCFTCL